MTSHISLVILVVLFTGEMHCYPQGAPEEACRHMFPVGHHVDAQTTPSPYRISVSPGTYSPNQKITVTLSVDPADAYYEGVFIQVRRASCDDEHDMPVGWFNLSSTDAYTYLQLRDCDGQMNAITHKNTFKKKELTFTWKAPAESVGTIYFRGTFVKETTEFWTDVSSDFVHASGSLMGDAMKCPVIQWQEQLKTGAAQSLTAGLFVTVTLACLTALFY